MSREALATWSWHHHYKLSKLQAIHEYHHHCQHWTFRIVIVPTMHIITTSYFVVNEFNSRIWFQCAIFGEFNHLIHIPNFLFMFGFDKIITNFMFVLKKEEEVCIVESLTHDLTLKLFAFDCIWLYLILVIFLWIQ